MISESEGLMLAFLLRADEFYILTRFSYSAFFQYMTFRMAHHTIEYYLKAGLSAHESAKEMKKLGHDLERLWGKSCECLPGLDVDVRIVEHINRFETTRYPGCSKYVRTAWGLPYDQLFSEVLPKIPEEAHDSLACFSLPDFDRIVFTLRSSLPHGKELPIIAVTGDAQEHLFAKNEFFRKEEI